MSTPKVFLYRYDGSPFSNKIEAILLLKNIPYEKVNVSRILPRPELSGRLGVAYRRIPVLSIGNDVYCDTSLIALALERRFKSSDGYETIFPAVKNSGGAVDAGIQKAFSMFYCDRALFSLAAGSLPWDTLPQNFVEDRSALRGTKLDIQAIKARQPGVLSNLSSHLDFAEEQLSDGREWLFNTVTPGLADISLHFIFAWIRPFPGIARVLDKEKFPRTLDWLDRLTRVIKQKAPAKPLPPANERVAAETIASSNQADPHIVGFDELEASRLKLKAGSVVAIVPDDYGQSHPTVGKLVGLDRGELVIETKGSVGKTVKVHFPRLGFIAKPVESKL